MQLIVNCLLLNLKINKKNSQKCYAKNLKAALCLAGGSKQRLYSGNELQSDTQSKSFAK